MQLSRYLKLFPATENPDSILIFSTLHGSKITASKTLIESVAAGCAAQEQLQILRRLGMVVPDLAAERAQVRTLFEVNNRVARRFTVLATLNLDCNLACPYCYEDPIRGKHYMSEATADLLVQSVLQMPLAAGRDVVVDFYGGEALLSQPLIHRISRPLQQELAQRGNSYSFTLVTNGTLLNEKTVAQLLPLGFSGARVTLDGPPDIHDSQRPFASGQGSFTAILRNLKEICGLVPVNVGGNFTRENYRRFPELLDILLEEGLTPQRVPSVTFAPITPNVGEGGIKDFGKGCACSSEPWLVEAALYLRQEILRRGYHTPKPRLSGCMVEYTNQIVVGHDGGLYKCPAFMGWKDLQIGTLGEGIVDYSGSHDLGAWQNEECLDCAYLPLCFGGCRFLQRLNTGSVQGVECRRAFLDATLEGMLRQDLALRPPAVPVTP